MGRAPPAGLRGAGREGPHDRQAERDGRTARATRLYEQEGMIRGRSWQFYEKRIDAD